MDWTLMDHLLVLSMVSVLASLPAWYWSRRAFIVQHGQIVGPAAFGAIFSFIALMALDTIGYGRFGGTGYVGVLVWLFWTAVVAAIVFTLRRFGMWIPRP